MRRLGEGEDRAVDLDRRVVVLQWPAGQILFFGVVAREVRADHFPGSALVAAPVDGLRGVVEQARIVLRDEDRGVPLETMLEVTRRHSIDQHGVDGDRATFAVTVVVATDLADVAARIDNVIVARVDRDVTALAAAHRVPVLRAATAVATQAQRRVVLLGAIHAVGPPVIHRDAIDLGRRLILHTRPGSAAVHGDLTTAVIAEDHVVGVIGVDPQRVRVAVVGADPLNRLAAVDRFPHRRVEYVHGVAIVRVGLNVRVVPMPLAQVSIAVDSLPALAGVVGAVQSAVRIECRNERVDACRIGW